MCGVVRAHGGSVTPVHIPSAVLLMEKLLKPSVEPGSGQNPSNKKVLDIFETEAHFTGHRGTKSTLASLMPRVLTSPSPTGISLISTEAAHRKNPQVGQGRLPLLRPPRRYIRCERWRLLPDCLWVVCRIGSHRYALNS